MPSKVGRGEDDGGDKLHHDAHARLLGDKLACQVVGVVDVRVEVLFPQIGNACQYRSTTLEEKRQCYLR